MGEIESKTGDKRRMGGKDARGERSEVEINMMAGGRGLRSRVGGIEWQKGGGRES